MSLAQKVYKNVHDNRRRGRGKIRFKQIISQFASCAMQNAAIYPKPLYQTTCPGIIEQLHIKVYIMVRAHLAQQMARWFFSGRVQFYGAGTLT